MIELAQVVKTYQAGLATPFTAVDGVSLRIPDGQLTVLKGPSGSGKTTLLTLIGCMARPTSGRIHLHGLPPNTLPQLREGDALEITSLPERFLTAIRRRTFGFIFQQFNLVRGISVLENVLLPTYPTGEDRRSAEARAVAQLEALGLTRHLRMPVDRLSGGEAQRVAIARALINEPAVLIADEPTAHLDSKLSEDFMALMGQFRATGRTLLITSHDPIVYDSPLADAVVEMRDGRVVSAP
ncbi:ABC transporter ATP-binding protein [Geothrix sp. PMB-07]|uniref:ABC transporter ATP-binding protein n=1 Tax=Geothrix sp. PMB-07 TaxID=3068640 RepID=UPI0027425577|nr:ABC transporter ATP-binding protein [Geothrix sp. PMB-07]WLT32285.1 ABC transporter ATP-binding protein [Geothrix sp. PMB-07]